jgi:hypothetical protein
MSSDCSNEKSRVTRHGSGTCSPMPKHSARETFRISTPGFPRSAYNVVVFHCIDLQKDWKVTLLRLAGPQGAYLLRAIPTTPRMYGPARVTLGPPLTS